MHAVKHTTARPPGSGHLQLERKKRTAKSHEAMEESNMHAVKHTTARPPCSGHLQLERKNKRSGTSDFRKISPGKFRTVL